MYRLAIVVAFVVSAALVVGCGRSQRTVVVPGGKMTVTTDKKGGETKTVTMESKDGSGKVTIGSQKTMTEAELGVPVYPGAESLASSKAEGKEGGKASSYENYTLSTTDSHDKVAAFYKSRLKDVQSSSTIDQGDHKMTMFSIERGKLRIVVQVMDDPKEKKTMIVVTRAVN